MTSPKKPEIIFVLSMDVEEEWDWSGTFPQDNFSVKNTRALPNFQAFCEALNIRPTYFVDYAVADDERSVNTLLKPAHEDKCEIGAHLHPWCNPPIIGETTEEESHLINLPIELVEKKLKKLHYKLTTVFARTPRSFRTGRWGINPAILNLLEKYNYEVDSSIYPYYANNFFSCNGSPTEPYWPTKDNALKSGKQRTIFEIPVSAGFNHTNYAACDNLHRQLSKPPFNSLKIIGGLWYTGLMRKIYLSPELATTSDMITLVNTSIARKQKVIHMYLHSPSLYPGTSEYAKNEREVNNIYTKIESVIQHLNANTAIRFCTISEAKQHLTSTTTSSTQ